MTRRPLARTYRPQRFSEVLGQSAPVKALGRAASSGEIASAYIFSGTRGIGKTTIARVFAKALNCENGPAADCCAECVPCQEIADGRSLDVLEMDAATHTGIDDVRELREAARYPPSRERFRVFIIDEAHQLSQAAWNGLLKILEEPPAWCVFLLCTTEPHKIPPTIESRALHFAFRSPPPAAIKKHLASIAQQEELTIDDESLDLLVKAADGSVRDGLSALDQVRAVAGDSIGVEVVRDALGMVPGEVIGAYVEALAAGDCSAALDLVAGLDEEGQDLRTFVAEVLERVRRVALTLAKGGSDPLVGKLDAARLVWLGRVLDQTEVRLRQGGPLRTLLDLATIRMTKVASLETLETLIAKLDAGGGAAPGAADQGRPAARGPSAAPAPRESPKNKVAPAPAAAPPAERPAADLLAELLAVIEQIRPPMAAYLARAEELQLGDDGGLTIVLPAGKQFWERKLVDAAGKKALGEAFVRIGRSEPKRIAVTVRDDDTGEAEAAPPTREEILSRARRDPLVRSLFDRFGAVVIDGQPIAARTVKE